MVGDAVVCVCKPEDASCSKFYLNGYARFHSEARKFACIASVSSRVSESFQAELMSDPRVAANYGALWSAATDELRWIIDLPADTWQALASVAQCSPAEMRDDTIRAAHVSYHFLRRRVLQPASELPWQLVRGDWNENLMALKALEAPPLEPVSGNMWRLMNEHKWSASQLVGVIELLGQRSWSSLTAEQQHGSLSALHKWHPHYGDERLVARSLLHQMVRLLPSLSKADKEMNKIARAMEKLDRKVPERAGGQHMLVKAIVSVARGRKEHFSFSLIRFHRARCTVDKSEKAKQDFNFCFVSGVCVLQVLHVCVLCAHV